MPISLISLPYAQDALEPHVSAETLRIHHGAHHKGYVDKINVAIEGTPLADADLETIITASVEKGDKKLFNSAAQTWNHGFYWLSLSPAKTEPSAELAAAITRDFGSLDALKEALSKEAVAHFASGWAWLVSDQGTLKVISTHDAGTALTEGVVPLLTIDVWEHAYYIDVKNKRPDYVKTVLDSLLNWDFASENFARDGVWRYPA